MVKETRFLIRLHGNVQGVGLRYHIKNKAQTLGLVGWVKNESDGTVSCLIGGGQARVSDFMQYLSEALPVGRVDKMDVEVSSVEGDLTDFSIEYE